MIHRDYSDWSSTLSVIIYDNSIEIANSGKSPYKAFELKKNHLSLPNNPDIAQIAFLRGYIDKIGRGTLKILEACKKADLKNPVWDISDNTVKLTFYSKISLARTTVKGMKMGDNSATDRSIDGAINDTIDRAIDGAVDGAVDRAIDSAVDRAIGSAIDGTTNAVKTKVACILKCVVTNEGKRNDTYVSMTKIPIGSIGRYMKLLRESGLIEFIGEATQTGGYFLTDKMRNILKESSKKH